MSKQDTYWAALPTLECIAEADDRALAHFEAVQQGDESILSLWRAANRACYSGFHTGGNLGSTGKQGEVKTIEVNDVGNLRQHLLNMMTGERLYFEPQADATDSASAQECDLARATIETAQEEKGFDLRCNAVADYMIRAGEGWGLKRWDESAGEDYVPGGDDGLLLPGMEAPPIETTGDVEYLALHPLDVVRDWTRSADRQCWWQTRTPANRWDLVAQYPALRDRLLNEPAITEVQARPMIVEVNDRARRVGTDDVAVYTLIHDRTPALPDGRLMSYVSPGCALTDGPLRHREVPLYRAAALDIDGYPLGYTLLWDILAPQMALNNLLSSITNTAAKYGRPVLWQPDGNGMTHSKVNGLDVLKGGTVAPSLLPLLNIPAPLFELVKHYLTAMERLSGVNAVFRGQAAEGQKGLSGAAYALFTARAIEFGNGFQRAWKRFVEKLATGTIQDYQDLGPEDAEYPVTAARDGKRPTSEIMRPAALKRVKRITLKLSNPMQATTAGRLALLENIRETAPGAIKTAEEVLEVAATGQLKPATQAVQKELDLIAAENEQISKGIIPVALISDHPVQHVNEHLAMCASPEARAPGSKIAQAALAHVADHMQRWLEIPPDLLAVRGIPPSPLAMGGMTPPPMPGEAGGTPPPEAGPTSSTGPMPQGGEMPGAPSMPVEPLSGERMAAPEGM